MSDNSESQAQRIIADTSEARSERSYKAAAHNPSNTQEGRLSIKFFFFLLVFFLINICFEYF
jgi:hypothetical protein